MPAFYETFLDDEQATHLFAAKLAGLATQGDCLLLSGEVGTGKTSFSRGFIQHLLPGTQVTSPTFNLVQTYPLPSHAAQQLWHADLYRLKKPVEFTELGFDDVEAISICLIEWPENARGMLPQDALTVHFSEEYNGRLARLESSNPIWQQRLAIL